MIYALLLGLGLGGVMGLILGIANKEFEVKEDPRLAPLTEMLPGYNCGACGFPGCSGLAGAIINGETDKMVCKPIKPDQKAKVLEFLANTPGPDGSTIKLK
ncbi:MAG: electron transporter RnfB [Erysipelotrichales bacterium]|nr:electron transporter RnfB [Erysipelotrichales bacterium]